MGNLAYIVLVLWLRLFALSSCQRVREHSSCQTWRVECVKTTPLLSLLTIPSSQRQKLVSLSFFLSLSLTHPITHVFSLPHTQSLSYDYHVSYVMNLCWGLCLSLFTLQLFDNLSLEVCQPLRPAALYDEAVSLVQDGSVPCRELR